MGAEIRAREAAHLAIDELGPNDLASVTFTWLSNPPQDFTNDKVKLHAAVDRFKMQFGPTCLTFLRALGALNATADYMASVQNRRKALIYIGGGVPVDVLTQRLLIGVPDDPPACGPALIDAMKDVFTSAQRANVAISTIDPFGLRADGGGASGAEVDFQRILAANTGGRAVVDTNDFKPGVAQIFRENSSYYMLGYAPTNTKQDGTDRRIDVKVDRPNLEVRTRKRYYAPDAKKIAAAAAKPQPPASVVALKNVLPKADVPLSLAMAPFAALDGKASIAIVLGVEQPSPGAPPSDDVEVSVAALGPFGATRATTRQSAHVVLSANPAGPLHYDVLASLDVPPGDYEILVGATSRALGKDGSIYQDVTVPDFAKEPLSLSGVVLSTTPTGAVAPRDALANIIPVVPTSQRTFSRTDHVSAFVRLYEGGKAPLAPVSLHMRIVNDQDEAILDTPETLSADRFDANTRAADQRVDVPLDRLAPGRYLLTIEATLGKTISERDVVFSVK